MGDIRILMYMKMYDIAVQHLVPNDIDSNIYSYLRGIYIVCMSVSENLPLTLIPFRQQTEILKQVFLTYFRVLKNSTDSPLMSAVLQGVRCYWLGGSVILRSAMLIGGEKVSELWGTPCPLAVNALRDISDHLSLNSLAHILSITSVQ